MKHVQTLLYAVSATFAMMAMNAAAQKQIGLAWLSGLYSPNSGGSYGVTRDIESGWTYIYNSYSADDHFTVLNGVETGGLGRVNRVGVVDPTWRVSNWPYSNSVFVGKDGNVVAASHDNNTGTQTISTYHKAANGLLVETPVSTANVGHVVTNNQSTRILPLYLPDGRHIKQVYAETMQYPEGRIFLESISKEGITLWTMATTQRHTYDAMTADVDGNIYAATPSYSDTNLIHRYRNDGHRYQNWQIIRPAVAGYKITAIRAVNEELIVVARVENSERYPGQMVSKYRQNDGSAVFHRTVPRGEVSIESDGSVTILSSDESNAIHIVPTNTDDAPISKIPVNVGGAPYIYSVVQQGDYIVIGGEFSLWYEGRLYENLIRLSANTYALDKSWAPLSGDNKGWVNTMLVDLDGGLVIGGLFQLGSQRSLARFRPDGQFDEGWSPKFEVLSVYSLSLGVNGEIYGTGYAKQLLNDVTEQPHPVFRISRIGDLDKDWNPGYLNAIRVIDLGEQGTFICFVRDVFTGQQPYLWILIDKNGGMTKVDWPVNYDSFWGNAVNDIQMNPYNGMLFFANAPSQLEGTVVEWAGRTAVRQSNVIGFDAKHYYFFSAEGKIQRKRNDTHEVDAAWQIDSLAERIVSFAGGADFDQQRYWLSGGKLANSHYGYSNSGFRLYAQPGSGIPKPNTVVEYFIPELNHFFVTGRDAEKEMLDGYPNLYRRTGMQFSAVSAVDNPIDSGLSSVCRFYAPPALGGSSTHFYGADNDCTWLQTFSGWQYEEHDFATYKPSTPIGGECPTKAPHPVYRLYNNRAAQNDSNHRYVVSTARLNEMVQAGWVDEGIVFCVISVTDSSALGAF